MKITEERRDELTVLRVAGELTLDTAEEFDRCVEEALAERRRDFIVDLTRMTRIDSHGLESLTSLHRQCEDELGIMRVCGAGETIRKIFELTRLDHQFALFKDADEAMASMV